LYPEVQNAKTVITDRDGARQAGDASVGRRFEDTANELGEALEKIEGVLEGLSAFCC